MRLVIIFFLIFIKFSVSQAEIVKQIIIEGNNRVTDETIKIYGDIEINKNYSEKDINNVIQKIYSTDFFDNVEAELKNNILTIKLKEYPIVNQLTILFLVEKFTVVLSWCTTQEFFILPVVVSGRGISASPMICAN